MLVAAILGYDVGQLVVPMDCGRVSGTDSPLFCLKFSAHGPDNLLQLHILPEHTHTPSDVQRLLAWLHSVSAPICISSRSIRAIIFALRYHYLAARCACLAFFRPGFQ